MHGSLDNLILHDGKHTGRAMNAIVNCVAYAEGCRVADIELDRIDAVYGLPSSYPKLMALG
jgi:hypothetical protein